MKKTILITILFCSLFILTTCKDWYENTDNIEKVLTSGLWIMKEFYDQPNGNTYDKPNSKYDYLENYTKNYVFTYDADGKIRYYSIEYTPSDFIIEKQTGNTLYKQPIDSLRQSIWKVEGDKFISWTLDLKENIASDTIIFNVKQYSDKIVEIVKQRYMYINLGEPGDTVINRDSVLIITHGIYKNVSDKYLVP